MALSPPVHTEAMTQPRFDVPIDDLERQARVDLEETVESVPLVNEPAADPRGESPDREWFASGG